MRGNRRRPWHQRMGRQFVRASGEWQLPRLTPLWVLGTGNVMAALAALVAGMLALALVFSAAAWGCHACLRRNPASLSGES